MKRPDLRFAVAMLMSLAGPVEAAPSPHEAAKLAIRTLDLQTNLPDATPPPDDSFWNFHVPPEVVEAMLWGALILGVGIVIWSVWDSLPVFDRSRRVVLGADGQVIAVDKLAEAQLEADDLANQGQFVEAMHVLLLQSLAELRHRLDLRFAESLTSREILRLSRLSAAARAALATIVRDVERTYFGAKPADIEDYRACRENFDAFKLALAHEGGQ